MACGRVAIVQTLVLFQLVTRKVNLNSPLLADDQKVPVFLCPAEAE
jgi:hypothetical protein